jgi:very-short-patch-repair endonuclease
MDRYISHFTAAKHWEIPYLTEIIRSDDTKPDCLHFTVDNIKARSKKPNSYFHIYQKNLPKGAVVLNNGALIASPELVFLQLANKLSIHKLILLGLQLCSSPPGKSLESITTKQKLETFIKKSGGHYGKRSALKALKYIENGSASIMESLLFMILTLPNALGGYGLRGATFNYEIKLKDYAGKRLNQQRCFVDLYYKSKKIAVEYDSYAFHNSPKERGQDSVRSAILDRQGIYMMHMNTIQLYGRESCDDFALNLARRLEKRIQIRSVKYEKMNTELRSLLPRFEKI